VSVVFANGTEGEEWMYHWCRHCYHDHSQHDRGDGGPGCSVVLHMYAEPDIWPEALLREPPGEFHMPPLHICGLFTPCEPCGGDREASERGRAVAYVTEKWAQHKAGAPDAG
jgi:hypothetical protein